MDTSVARMYCLEGQGHCPLAFPPLYFPFYFSLLLTLSPIPTSAPGRQ